MGASGPEQPRLSQRDALPAAGRGSGSVRSRARGAALPDRMEIVRADGMMSSAMRALLARRTRREEAETIWL